MNTLAAFLYDGRTSARREVALHLGPGWVSVRGDGVDLRHPVAQLRFPPRVGNVRPTIVFPDGAMCEVLDGEALERWLRGHGKGRFQAAVYRWENSLRRAFVALALTLVAIWAVIQYGIPLLAREVAFALPPATASALGRNSLKTLDRLVFKPSKLPRRRREEITAMFRAMTRGLPDASEYRLKFRASQRIGANAFALPSGIIVLTDGMVELAHNDDELMAVLAHEIGHVENRHTLRQVLQNSVSALVIASLTGDVFSSTSAAAALPTVLVQTKFSRDFEIEADDFAARYLRARHVSPRHLADILSRLARSHRNNGGLPDFLSTHPATQERIRRLERAR